MIERNHIKKDFKTFQGVKRPSLFVSKLKTIKNIMEFSYLFIVYLKLSSCSLKLLLLMTFITFKVCIIFITSITFKICTILMTCTTFKAYITFKTYITFKVYSTFNICTIFKLVLKKRLTFLVTSNMKFWR